MPALNADLISRALSKEQSHVTLIERELLVPGRRSAPLLDVYASVSCASTDLEEQLGGR